LDAFKKADAEAPWGWFVVSTKILSEHDLELLTAKSEEKDRSRLPRFISHCKVFKGRISRLSINLHQGAGGRF
jgi:hypothetical protein